MRESKDSKGDTKAKNDKATSAARNDGKDHSANISTAPPAAKMAAVDITAEKGTPGTPGDLEEENVTATDEDVVPTASIEGGPETLEERVGQLEEALRVQCEQTQKYYEVAQQYESKWRSTSKELLRLRHVGTAVDKVDDDILTQSWNHTRYLIRTLTQKYFKSQRSVTHYSTRVDTVKHLSLEYKRYMKSRDLRPVIIQAYLFHRLLSQRSGARLAWAGGRADHFRELSRTMQPTPELRQIPKLINDGEVALSEVQSYQSWRATTAALLATRTDPKEVSQRINELTNRVYMEIHPYATLREPQLAADLKEVIIQLVELDELICRSRAIVLIQTWYGTHRGERVPYEFNFGPDMESEDGFEEAKEGMVVEMVVSQALIKIGNGDGGGYDRMSILCKAKVICSGTRENMERSGRLK
jgi:hypothetical protein